MFHHEYWTGSDPGQPLEKLSFVPEDKGWTQYLPPGHRIVSTEGYTASYWSQSGKIDIRLEDGSAESYFIKIHSAELGRVMAEGEYRSMMALWEVSPDLVPKPLGFGAFQSNEDLHFVLFEFVDLIDEVPDKNEFCPAIAELHRKSMDRSPTNKFGFEVTTCNSTVQQYTTWNSSWEAFYVENLRHVFELEEEAHGQSDRIDELRPRLLEKVVPRLLRPLETEGRTVRPCLCHGDLWDGNAAVHGKTGQPYIFDASALWAHNEYEQHKWRAGRFKFNQNFRREYFRHFPVSQPKDEWDDRNLLYSISSNLLDSILFKDADSFREYCIETMEELVHKYPNGYTGSARRKDQDVASEDASNRNQSENEL